MKVFRSKLAAGFTLVEIMIVVLIIGILLAIAIPNFVSARESARAKACVGNLKQIDSASQQYAMDNKMNSTAAISGVPILVTTSYIRSTPSLPRGRHLRGRRLPVRQPDLHHLLVRRRHRLRLRRQVLPRPLNRAVSFTAGALRRPRFFVSSPQE